LRAATTQVEESRVIVSHLTAKNWRNFRKLDVNLRDRVFVVGPNASGKSNLLDIFRFLRDVARPEGGGLQKALKDRGGVPKVRSLSARRYPEIEIEVQLSETSGSPALWRYALGIKQQSRASRLPYVSYERVWSGSKKLLDRPTAADERDPARLTQTYLEQIGSNADFREIARFFQRVTYLHLVPQLLRFADQIQGRTIEEDPFGQGFLERVARASETTRKTRLRSIEQALRIAVPQLKKLQFTRDDASGRPHLQALYSHWRKDAGWQKEDQFSDGTLRLIGLLWSLLESDSLLLLEEPELSLNAAIVAQLAPLVHRLQKARKRQVIVSTHSADLLSDPGIDARELIVLSPVAEGTDVKSASDISDVRALLEAGLPAGEAVLPKTRPETVGQLALIQ
jgi:predicted ATPase